MAAVTQIRIALDEERTVSGLLTGATDPFASLVLAHGAGAGMRHAFMERLADALAGRGVSLLRYQFPYMEAGLKRPDPPAIAQRAVRSAVASAAGLPLFAGGKSFGARMTSQAQAAEALPGVRGLVFFGFPLHPAGAPAVSRAEHLSRVRVPMLFLQGSRDALAEIGLVEGVVGRLGGLATLHVVADADHSFHVPARSGRSDAEVMGEIAERSASWMRATAAS